MATDENFSLSLNDLPRDELSVLFFHLSPKDIISLGATSKQMFRNVQEAKQLVLKTAQELIKSLSVTDTVVTFIDDLDKAIRFAHDVKSLNEESEFTDEGFCLKVMALPDSYGYEFISFDMHMHPDFPDNVDAHVTTPSKLRFVLEWHGDNSSCRIKSDEARMSRKLPEFATYQFSKAFCLKFKHFSVNKLSPNTHDTLFQLSRDASLRQIVQAATDMCAINRLYGNLSVKIISLVDIDLDDVTGYGMSLDGEEIKKYQCTYTNDKVSMVHVSGNDLLPEMVHIFGFLRFLMEKKSSE
jgi:hypothetical protein